MKRLQVRSIKSVIIVACAIAMQSYSANMADSGYSHNASITINTSGAGISSDQYKFPVLIRLTSSNFNFSQTMTNGEDIRFANAAGSPLPYDIERWDAANNAAEIWVRVDTIKANNSSQQVKMYWTKNGAASGANSGAVFDTLNGFVGVWHLSEVLAGGAGSMKDRTYHANHGTATSGLNASNTRDCIVGKGVRFTGFTDSIACGGDPSLNVPDSFTISSWVYYDSTVIGSSDHPAFGMFGKCYQMNDMDYGVEISSNPVPHSFGLLSPFWGSDTWQNSCPTIPTKSWFLLYVVYRRDPANQPDFWLEKIYFNNSEAGSRSHGKGWPSGLGRLGIGKANGHHTWPGYLDEVRVEKRPRSADWIKLCYENQKTDQSMISVGSVSTGIAKNNSIVSSNRESLASVLCGPQGLVVRIGNTNPCFVDVVTLSGEIVTTFAGHSSQEYILTKSNLYSGMYLVHISNNQTTITRKIAIW